MRTPYWTIILALLLAACAPAAPVESTLTPDSPGGGAGDGTTAPAITSVPGTAVPGDGGGPRDGEAVLIFERGGGIAGIHEVWTVYTDGTTESAEGAGQPVAPAEVEALMAAADRLGFWEMDEAYGTNDTCADCFTYNLTLKWEGRTKTVTTVDAASDAPPELNELLSAVSQLVAKAQGG